MTTIDRLLAEAHSGLELLESAQAMKAVERGAVLIDMRPYEQTP